MFKVKSKDVLIKSALLITAFLMLISISVGSSLAWLTDSSEQIRNTFFSGKLFENPDAQFTLWEHKAADSDNDGRYTLTEEILQSNDYEILPGVGIPKDPTVDIRELEENAYLFLKVTDTLPEGLDYSIDAENWEQLFGYDDIWVYCGAYAENNVIKGSDAGKMTFTVNVLTQIPGPHGNYAITVTDDYAGTSEVCELSFNAYMAQVLDNGNSATEAWENTFGNN